MTTQAHQIEIDVEAVIAAAARTAVKETCPDLPDEAVQQAVEAAHENGMYQLMVNAIRPEAAAAILVREAIREAKSMAEFAG